MPFTEMTETQLVNHIVTTHHYYVKNAMPVIAGHLEKVANKHGDSFPLYDARKGAFRDNT